MRIRVCFCRPCNRNSDSVPVTCCDRIILSRLRHHADVSGVARLDLYGAWQANAMMLLLLPWLAAVLCSWAVRYIKTGQKNLTHAQTLLFGVAAYYCCCLAFYATFPCLPFGRRDERMSEIKNGLQEIKCSPFFYEKFPSV